MRRVYEHRMTSLDVKRLLAPKPSRWLQLFTIVKGVSSRLCLTARRLLVTPVEE
jgi:hypothetical protein